MTETQLLAELVPAGVTVGSTWSQVGTSAAGDTEATTGTGETVVETSEAAVVTGAQEVGRLEILVMMKAVLVTNVLPFSCQKTRDLSSFSLLYSMCSVQMRKCFLQLLCLQVKKQGFLNAIQLVCLALPPLKIHSLSKQKIHSLAFAASLNLSDIFIPTKTGHPDALSFVWAS